MAQHQHCAGLSSIGQGVCTRSDTCARYADWTLVKDTGFNLCAGTQFGRFLPIAGLNAPPTATPVGKTFDLFGAAP